MTNELEAAVMREGYLPDFEGNPVLASCQNCAHCRDQSDGPEYGASFYGCEKNGKQHMSNLKGFPFKTPQKCCDLHFVHLVDWDEESKQAAANIAT
jgi:hypothetical protein